MRGSETSPFFLKPDIVRPVEPSKSGWNGMVILGIGNRETRAAVQGGCAVRQGRCADQQGGRADQQGGCADQQRSCAHRQDGCADRQGNRADRQGSCAVVQSSCACQQGGCAAMWAGAQDPPGSWMSPVLLIEEAKLRGKLPVAGWRKACKSVDLS